jgi:hypothetical protein
MSISRLAKKLVNSGSEKSFAFKFRKKRAEKIIALINECYEKHGEVKIIDIGGTKAYWSIIPMEFLKERKVRIHLVNLPDSSVPPEKTEIFTFQHGDGCSLANIGDKSFHLAHSNSVIEHVGSWENKVRFALEIQRVAETYYLQTPNYWFPLEPHFVTLFFHWLPESMRIKLVQHFDLGWVSKRRDYDAAKTIVDSCSLLSAKEIRRLFPNASLFRERFFGLTKSLIVTGK